MVVPKILETCTPEEIRACLYYAARHFKQANSEDYDKDIFEDEEQNLPSEFIIKKTIEYIKEIEAREGMPAKDFDEGTFIRLMNEITLIESNLSIDLTDEEVSRGAKLAAEMAPPTNKSYDDDVPF